MATHVARYAVTFGLAGCYLPDSHDGVHEFNTRRDLAAFIRDELERYEFPKAHFAQAHVLHLWKRIKRHGSSSMHFSIFHREHVLSFHGLTEEEFRQQADIE
ncbi:MAG TPA: hypothetical protein VGU20_13975 [Stellaceae bacterium]|nr:hypothetical protein [Stellaceae bacterium]